KYCKGGRIDKMAIRPRRKTLSPWMEKKCSERFTTHHRIYGDAAGVHVIPVRLPDLLMHYLIYVAKDSSDAASQVEELKTTVKALELRQNQPMQITAAK